MSKKLKIAVMVDQLIPGGVQKTAIDEVRELKRLGLDAKLLILMRQGFQEQNISLVRKVPFEFISDRYPSFLRASPKLPVFHFLSTLHLLSPFLAPFYLGSRDFDLIICHGTTTALTAVSISKFRKVPYIFFIHDPMLYILEKIYTQTLLKPLLPFLKIIIKYIEKIIIINAKICVLDSSVHQNYIKTNYHLKPEVIYLATAPKKIRKKIGDWIISFGRWDRGKNLEKLLQAVKDIPSAKLLIAGIWTNQKDLVSFNQKVHKLKLEDKVKIVTSFNESELSKFSLQARVWVHPHFEAFSLSALEAASYGLPIIMPTSSGATELFQNNVHGFFLEKTTPQTLKKSILMLLRNRSLALEMGQAAQKVALQFTPQKRAIKLAQIIEIYLLNPQKELVVLETAHVGTEGLAGGDVLMEKMAAHLKGFKITVIGPQNGIIHWQNFKDSNLRYINNPLLDNLTNPFIVLLNYLIRIARAFYKIPKRTSSILYSSTDVLPDIAPAFLVKIFNAKTIWIARLHHLVEHPFTRIGNPFVNISSYSLQQISLFMIKRANIVIVLNENLKVSLSRKIPKSKIAVIGGGVDIVKIQNAKPAKVKFDAVFLGRIHRTKGVFDLPIIWQIVCQNLPKCKLVIIGTGSKNIVLKLKKDFKKFNLEKNVDFLGYLDQNHVYSILKSSKVFVFCDHEAGFGLAPLEAMAAGLPIIGFDIGILGNIFKSGYLTVPAFDKNLFAQKITLLLKNNKLRNDLRRKAQVEASKFDWTKISSKFERILFTMLQ